MTDAAETTEVDDALVFECDLDAPPEKVWRALSVPELREAWLGEPDGGPARVLEAEPGSQLVLDWPTDGQGSIVTFEVTEGDGGGAHLKIVHAPRTTASILPFRRRATMMFVATAAFRKAA